MVGFDRSPVPAKPGGGKKKKGPKKSPKKRGRKKEPPPKKPKPTPSATSSPTPTPSFDCDCFTYGRGGRFVLPTPATGPGAIGVASIPITAAANALSIPLPGVPNVAGLTSPFTQTLSGVNADNCQALLDNLRQAKTIMNNTGLYQNQLGDQADVIECFQNFCKDHGWTIF
jgi:hypothetical protein